MLARCTSSLDLHMLIVPYWYLFRTLLVPKVALGLHMLVKLTEKAKTHSAAAGYFSQLHRLISDELDRVAS